MSSEQIQNVIDNLRTKAKTGADWATICALEDQRMIVEAGEIARGEKVAS